MIGRTLGHYRITAKIGAGGMGEVYRAHDERLDRDVALKVLPSGTLADDTARRHFHREALALSRLNHPSIQTIHDFDTQDGLDFLVTEFVEGVSLDERIAVGPLPNDREVIRLGLQLADGLAAAHEKWVVHRDLKPSNLRVTADGRLKILDFGVAKFLQPPLALVDHDATTQSGPAAMDVAGTLPYMAPEQVLGEPVDARTDIYAAGVTLYELATGRRPFRERLVTALTEAILHHPPAPPGRLRPDLAPRVEEIILKCLEKDRDVRYQTARELLVDLRRADAPTSGSAASSFPRARPRRPTRVWALVAVAAIVTAVVPLLKEWAPPPPGGPGPPRFESLAVLPLENLSGSSAQDYFAVGMTEALITDLGRIHALRVISRTSVMQYAGARRSVVEIAQALGVDVIVEGSVLQLEGRADVTVRLVDARSDAQIWARSYQRELRDVPALQRELALEIAREVRVELTPEEQHRLAGARPVDPAVQEAYLRGTQLNQGTQKQRRLARAYFEKAVSLDPDYAPGYAGLADSHWSALDQPPAEAMPRAKMYARQALALDDGLARAHRAQAAIAFYGDWDWVAAEESYRRAIELNPSDAETRRMYSVFLSAMGRSDAALAELDTARRLDPLSLDATVTAGWALYFARDYEGAVGRLRAALELSPNSVGAHACLGACLLAMGRPQDAVRECEAAVALSGGDVVREVDEARAYARAGQVARARDVLARLRRKSEQIYVPSYFQATILAALGDTETAFSLLEQAFEARDLYLAWLKVDPAVDPLRSDPRFDELLRRVGLSQ